MKKVVCFLIAIALAVHSSNGRASEKQTERKGKLNKETIALVAISALAVVGGGALVKVVQKNKSLAKKVASSIEGKNASIEKLEATHTKMARQIEGKNASIEKLEATHTKMAGQIEVARDAEEKTIEKVISGISTTKKVKYMDKVKYSDDFVE